MKHSVYMMAVQGTYLTLWRDVGVKNQQLDLHFWIFELNSNCLVVNILMGMSQTVINKTIPITAEDPVTRNI